MPVRDSLAIRSFADGVCRSSGRARAPFDHKFATPARLSGSRYAAATSAPPRRARFSCPRHMAPYRMARSSNDGGWASLRSRLGNRPAPIICWIADVTSRAAFEAEKPTVSAALPRLLDENLADDVSVRCQTTQVLAVNRASRSAMAIRSPKPGCALPICHVAHGA